jgi:hypothetical protein
MRPATLRLKLDQRKCTGALANTAKASCGVRDVVAHRRPCVTSTRAPPWHVAKAGADADAVVHRVYEASGTLGYDAGGERFGDMLELGVIDPVKVVRTALQNAVSIASLLLTTDCMIAIERNPRGSAESAAAGARMFGEEF